MEKKNEDTNDANSHKHGKYEQRRATREVRAGRIENRERKGGPGVGKRR